MCRYPLNVIAEGAFVYTALPALLERGWALHGWVGYAPIAVLFQAYEWVIFVPAYVDSICTLAQLLNHTTILI